MAFLRGWESKHMMCTEVTPGSVNRNYSCQGQGIIWDVGGSNPGLLPANALPIVLLLWPLVALLGDDLLG